MGVVGVRVSDNFRYKANFTANAIFLRFFIHSFTKTRQKTVVSLLRLFRYAM